MKKIAILIGAMAVMGASALAVESNTLTYTVTGTIVDFPTIGWTGGTAPTPWTFTALKNTDLNGLKSKTLSITPSSVSTLDLPAGYTSTLTAALSGTTLDGVTGMTIVGGDISSATTMTFGGSAVTVKSPLTQGTAISDIALAFPNNSKPTVTGTISATVTFTATYVAGA